MDALYQRLTLIGALLPQDKCSLPSIGVSPLAQVLHTLYHTDENVLLGAPTGSGKTISAELTILRAFAAHPGQKIIYIAPLKVHRLLLIKVALARSPHCDFAPGHG